jgi:O-antigen/teichoic acid export membrane protein
MRTDLDSSAPAMARGAAINLGGAMAANALTFLFAFVMTHVVSVKDIGLFSIAVTVVALSQIPALFGLETGTVRFVALGAAVDDERSARGSLQAALTVATLTSVVLSVAIFVEAPTLTSYFFHKPEASGLLRLVSLSLPALTIGRVAMAAVQGFGVMTYSAWLGSLRSLVNLAAALPLLALGLDVDALAIAALVTAWSLCLISLVLLVRVHPKAFVPATSAWRLGPLLRFSAPQTLTSTLFFAIVWMDTLMLARFRSAAEVGIYAIIGRLMTPATLVSTAVGQMFAPRIAAEDARGDHGVLQTMLKRVTYWNTAVSIPFFVSLMLLPVPLLGLFGPRYKAGATALAILSAGQLVNTAAGPLGQVINLSGRPYVTMLNNALVGALNVGGCIVLIPRFGMAGAAASTAGALTLVNLIKLVQVRVMFGIMPFRRDSLRLVLAAFSAAAIAAPVAFAPPWPGAAAELLAAGTVLFLGYLVIVWALGVGDEERELFTKGRVRIARLLHT